MFDTCYVILCLKNFNHIIISYPQNIYFRSRRMHKRRSINFSFNNQYHTQFDAYEYDIRGKKEKIYKAIVIAKICTQKFKKQIMKKMYDAFIFFFL